MGACGSKEQFKEQAAKLASSAQAAAGSAWGDLSELTAAYNPLQAKGDANSRCDGAAGGLCRRRRATTALYLPPAGHSWPSEPRCKHVAALRSSTALTAPVRCLGHLVASVPPLLSAAHRLAAPSGMHCRQRPTSLLRVGRPAMMHATVPLGPAIALSTSSLFYPCCRCCLMLKQVVELTAKVKKTQKEWKASSS